MRTITKIACRTIGALGIGAALYDATRISGQFAKNGSQYQQAKYLQRRYFDSRTTDSISYTRNNIRQKTFEMESQNPLPSLWGKIKGGTKGLLYGLGNNLPVIVCGALALCCKNTFAKIGATGVGLGVAYTILRDGFGFGKNHPMD
jgi:hypothetical protein